MVFRDRGPKEDCLGLYMIYFVFEAEVTKQWINLQIT